MTTTNRQPQRMVETWRGGLLESFHAGHAVICDEKGEIIEAWGNPDEVIFPPRLASNDVVIGSYFNSTVTACGLAVCGLTILFAGNNCEAA